MSKCKESPHPTLVLGLTGSVASIKGKELILGIILECKFNVVIIQTKAAMHFTAGSEEESWDINV